MKFATLLFQWDNSLTATTLLTFMIPKEETVNQDILKCKQWHKVRPVQVMFFIMIKLHRFQLHLLTQLLVVLQLDQIPWVNQQWVWACQLQECLLREWAWDRSKQLCPQQVLTIKLMSIMQTIMPMQPSMQISSKRVRWIWWAKHLCSNQWWDSLWCSSNLWWVECHSSQWWGCSNQWCNNRWWECNSLWWVCNSQWCSSLWWECNSSNRWWACNSLWWDNPSNQECINNSNNSNSNNTQVTDEQ